MAASTSKTSGSVRWIGACALGLALSALGGLADAPESGRPNVLVVTIDTLRADHLSSYGYGRPTSPNLDRLILNGTHFTQARTVEPLTNPAIGSMVTSLYPHEHGGSRNGLRMRTGLPSLPKALQARGYRTAAFMGNWTLRDKLSGLGEHFDEYEEVLTRRRWFGLIRGEATAEDLTSEALTWLEEQRSTRPEQPFLLWTHYTEPHAPYRAQREFLGGLGLSTQRRELTDADRYDSEIAYVDHWIGELVRGLEEMSLMEQTVIVIAADHGESLGEHGYWGHGRHLYEPTLHIPMALYWPGQIPAREIAAPALNIDIAPTLLSLLGFSPPAGFHGFDWAGVLAGGEPPADRVTRYQAHRGAVLSKHDSDLARQSGLLAVGTMYRDQKEIFRVEKGQRMRFDLADDPRELASNVAPKDEPSEGLLDWMRIVYDGLASLDVTPPQPLDDESIEQLRSLGYVD
jgi:arylsulfatase A-like enzyme